MLYINDPKTTHYKYDEAVNAAIKTGIDPKRAYLYLAALGVRGAFGRVLSKSGMGYEPPVKLAVIDNKLVTRIDFCGKCQGLIIQ